MIKIVNNWFSIRARWWGGRPRGGGVTQATGLRVALQATGVLPYVCLLPFNYLLLLVAFLALFKIFWFGSPVQVKQVGKEFILH